MILDQGPLRLAHGLFDRIQLLSNIHALTTIFEHRDDASQMPIGTLEAFDDCAVGLVHVAVLIVLLTH
ncbi:hypothetical protein KAM426_09730 [Aquipseudomonas alcaligenes]|nr:hypothetical protein KAM426_09730 [Pseudomonas alcaligenes]